MEKKRIRLNHSSPLDEKVNRELRGKVEFFSLQIKAMFLINIMIHVHLNMFLFLKERSFKRVVN